jgi:hypothetical protein
MFARLKNKFLKRYYKFRLKFMKNPELTEFYFGYGANLNILRFKKLGLHIEVVGNGTLDNHIIRFTLPTEYIGKGRAGAHNYSGQF